MTELAETNSQFVQAWCAFVDPMPNRELVELPGLEIVWANAVLPVYNAMFLKSPAATCAELEDRARRAIEFMRTKPNPGMLFVCHEWLPEDLPNGAGDLFDAAGFHPAMKLTGMAADDLVAPVRPLPRLEYLRVADSDTLNTISDINCLAYGFPPEWGRESMSDPRCWGSDSFGYVAYHQGDAVAAAATHAIDGRLYVALVATLPEAQRRGYAEAVMRHSLVEAAKATGLKRTILHATEAGHPVYIRMGYHGTGTFTAYMSK